MHQSHPYLEMKKKFVAVLNNPVFDQTSDAHVQEFFEAMRQRMKITPLQLGRLIAKNWEYRPGRQAPRFQRGADESFRSAVPVIPNSAIAPLQYLKPEEISAFLQQHPDASKLYKDFKGDVLRFKVRQDFPTRAESAISVMGSQFAQNPAMVYEALSAPARFLEVNSLVGGYRRGHNFWGAEERLEELDSFFYNASRQLGPNLKSAGLLAGDIIWFKQYGVGGIWDGKSIDMPNDYAEDEAHLPEWIQFPDFPLDHYRDIRKKWPDMRMYVPLSEKAKHDILENWDEASQTTIVHDPLDTYLVEIDPRQAGTVREKGFNNWFPGPFYSPVALAVEDGRYRLISYR